MDPNNPASVLPMLPQGSAEDAIYVEVGRALTKWESLEFTLSETYEALLDAQTDGAAYGYGLLVAFTGRHALLESAEAHLPFRDEPPFSNLRKLIARAAALCARRNDIAHGVCAEVGGRGWFLVPAWYNSKKAPKQDFGPKFNYGVGSYAYSAEQLAIYGGHFAALNSELAPYRRQIQQRWRTQPR